MATVNPHIQQGIQLQRNGDLAAAAELYERVLALESDHAQALHYLGLVHYQRGDLSKADDLLSRSLVSNPSDANTYSDLGMVKVRLEKYADSLPLFAKSLAINPNHLDALNNMAAALKSLQRFDQAALLYKRMVKLQPRSASVLCNLANAQFHSGDESAAIASYQKAIRLNAGSRRARIGLGEAYESSGKFKQAKLQYLAVLRRDENSPLALSRLIQSREGQIDDKWLQRAHALLEDPATKAEGKIRLNISLGYYYDRNKKFDAAFEHLKAGNDCRSEHDRFDSQAGSAEISKLIEALTEEFFESVSSYGNTSERPIFIVGMPRSGTTLTEQILASHPEVAPGGELSALLRASFQVREYARNSQPYPAGLLEIGRIGISRLAKGYLDRLEKVSSTARMVTDKLPFNFMHLGMIAVLFPNAKVIHCSRHPMDNCLSCYFTSFADQIKFANNLESLGRYYLDYHRLMRHWHDVLPIEILDLKYEEMVSRTDANISRLLSYCGLEFDPACAQFYRTARGIRTPSRWQVRQPIYSSSVRRWRNYEKQLEPLRQILEPVLKEYET